MKERATLGVIGGSGVYDIDGLGDLREVEILTPWGTPSDHFLLGRLGEIEVAFLPRHGRNHVHTPTEIPFLANIYAMRMLGVQRVLSVSAVGSLTEEYAPGEFVLVDQFIDRTTRRRQTFFGDGLVAHLPMAHPIDAQMADVVERQAAQISDLTLHRGGAYVTIEGPQFSTLAESELFRSWGAKIIGMTNGTEAKLVREAGMSYCTIAMVTDYDCWHPHHGDVDIEQILRIARSNAAKVKQLISASLKPLVELGPSPCRQLLQFSVLTPPEHISAQARERTAALFEN
jgi:5'-methylthioadenosine phosphorylase